MDTITNLAWLPAAPDDFVARAKALKEAKDEVARDLIALATHKLDANQLYRLARIVERARSQGNGIAGLTPVKIGILSNATTDFLGPAIVGSGLRHGLAIECVTGAYGQFLQDALDPISPVNRARCDMVLLAIDSRGYGLRCSIGDVAAEETAVTAALQQIDQMRAGLSSHGATVIVQSVVPRPETLLGSFDALLPGSEAHVTAAFNQRLVAKCAESTMLLFDVAGLASRIGADRWHDPIAWNLAQQPFAHSFIPLYAEALARLIAAARGKSRKALVLDLDNTCWSGVIGDDGLEGINVSPGDPVGEAHLALQAFALNLRECGIVLAVSSKNTDEIAREPFRSHPDMLLREEHISVFQANWTDKATNLVEIAKALNFGLDALVFVDDNPAERELIRQRLPEVAVPELPQSPALYSRVLAAAGYFEAVTHSDEDRERARFYSENAQRIALETAVADIDEYLRSLEMRIHFAPFDERGRARITQLINKSNQFNLTTRRYTEAEIAALDDDPSVTTLQVRLKDRFGDNGMISTVICRDRGNGSEIDTWLMSCRVLGRRVEEAVLAELVRRARERGISKLIGIYRPTERNGLVAEHYQRLGFSHSDSSLDRSGEQRWVLDISELGDDSFPDVFAEIDVENQN